MILQINSPFNDLVLIADPCVLARLITRMQFTVG